MMEKMYKERFENYAKRRDRDSILPNNDQPDFHEIELPTQTQKPLSK